VAVAAVALLALAPALASGAPVRRVLVVIVPGGGAPGGKLVRFERAGLPSLGLMTASVGSYSQQQTLLDITQGARVPLVDYAPSGTPALSLRAGDVVGWPAIARRASSADPPLVAGALASAIPEGAGYVAAWRRPSADAVIAAGGTGRIGAVSVGTRASLIERVRGLLAHKRLVIAQLADVGQLRALVAARPPGELLIALEAPAPTRPGATRPPVLLALGAAGLASGPGTLTSASTRTDGLVAATDLAPTILRWLGLREPASMIGQPLAVVLQRSTASLAAFANRLALIGARRLAVALWFVLAWVALALLTATRRRGLADVLRLGGLAAVWAPACVLATAALAPAAAVESAIVVGGSFALALVSDRFVAWPQAAVIPAVIVLVLYAADLLAGSGLVERSLLGSDPISASRYFGAGNELVAVLMVELLVALSALRPARALPVLLGLGGALTFVLAWGRGGANLGAIFTVGGAVATAGLALTPGVMTLKRAGGAIVGALGVLVALEILAGGAAIDRRVSEVWHAFAAFPMPLAVLGCLTGALVVTRERHRLPEPWGACLAGMFGGALLGSLAADSGPRVLLIGCAGALCALAYVLGGARRTPSRGRLYMLLTRALVPFPTLQSGSGIPRPDPPNFWRR